MEPELVVSPSLLAAVGIDKPVPIQMRIGYEELLGLTVNPADYVHYDPRVDVDALANDEGLDELFVACSQRYEFEATLETTSNHHCNIDYNVPENGDLDKFFVEASQQLETEAKFDKGASRRFGAPCSSGDIEAIKKSRVPRKTQANTSWALNIWREWAACRLKTGLSSEEEHAHKLDGDITKMDTAAVSFWIQRFVLEARKGDGKSYSPDSLYQLCCGLQRAMRDADHNVNFFDDFEFAQFRSVIDGELKRLNRMGLYVNKKKANVITVEMEDILWRKRLLGDHSPQVLSDTMVYLVGLFFALRSGEEHRRLRHNPPQITLIEPPGGTPYLVYKEDVSKTNQAGLRQRNLVPKEVVHHANMACPDRCLVRIYKLYNDLCPLNRPDGAFYLAPLACPKERCWFKRAPLGHCKLAAVVPRLMKSAGIEGYFTNHSLRATATTRLYDAQVDEATIMQRTGHRSTDGVRAYKRTSEKMKELSSNVLNHGQPSTKKLKVDDSKGIQPETVKFAENIMPIPKPPQPTATSQFTVPGMNFGSASNFTVNIHYGVGQ